MSCCKEGLRSMCCQWSAKKDDYSVERECCRNQKAYRLHKDLRQLDFCVVKRVYSCLCSEYFTEGMYLHDPLFGRSRRGIEWKEENYEG